MPDILLIQPPIRDFYLTAKRTIPYGLACIAATLLRDGFSVQILDALATRKTKKIALPPEMSYLGAFYPGPDISPFSLFHEFRHYGLDFDRIGEIARDSGAFLIGISSLFTAYSDEALATVRAVKKHCPRAAVVLGGHHPTEMPEDVLRNECVDFVIRGEGEEALPRLARILGASISQEGASPQGADPFANVHKKPPGITAPGLTSPCRAGSPADPGEMPPDMSAPGGHKVYRAGSGKDMEEKPPGTTAPGLTSPCRAGSHADPGKLPPDMSAPGGHKVCGIAGFPAGIFESVPGLGFRRSDGSLFLNDPPILARTPAKIPNQRLSFDSPVAEAPAATTPAARLNSDIFINAPCITEDLDQLPLPAIELIDSAFYSRRKAPCAVIVASRGCPLKCSYCSVGCASWSRFRLKSRKAVMRELERAVFGMGVRFIDFEDENISFDRKWFLALLKSIRERFAGGGPLPGSPAHEPGGTPSERRVEFRAMNGLFAPTLDEEVIRSMRDAGFTALNLSLCTTSREQLRRFRRPDAREAFERALQLAEKYGLDTVGYIIAGAPGQSAEDSVADLLYLASLKVLAGVSIYYPAPGSSDFELCRKEGLLPAHNSLMRSTALPISDSTTREQAATLLRLGRILNFMKSLSSGELAEVLAPAREEQGPRSGRLRKAEEQGRGREPGPPGSANPVPCPERLVETAAYVLAPERLRETAGPERNPNSLKAIADDLPGRCKAPQGADHRREAGKLLLAMFLGDGIIRGATPDGEIFEHRASRALCLRFRDGIRGMRAR